MVSSYYSKSQIRARPTPHEVWWARFRARPASFNPRTKPGSQHITLCGLFPRAGVNPASLVWAPPESLAGPEFCAPPGRREHQRQLWNIREKAPRQKKTKNVCLCPAVHHGGLTMEGSQYPLEETMIKSQHFNFL